MGKIWVVEDENSLLLFLCTMLDDQGYQTVPFKNGQQVLDYLKRDHPMPSLIITDIMMPEVDGYSLYMRLQEDSRTRDIPVIVTTAKGQTLASSFAGATGVVAILQKPFNLELVRRAVAKVMRPTAGGPPEPPPRL